MVKRFALFAGYTYYPRGGWSDFVDSFDSEDEAVAAITARQLRIRLNWYHVVDLTTGKVV